MGTIWTQDVFGDMRDCATLGDGERLYEVSVTLESPATRVRIIGDYTFFDPHYAGYVFVADTGDADKDEAQAVKVATQRARRKGGRGKVIDVKVWDRTDSLCDHCGVIGGH